MEINIKDYMSDEEIKAIIEDEIDYKDLDESIYTQFAKTMAKNVDTDIAKTPLVDLLTGYTRYKMLQIKIDKANEILDKLCIYGYKQAKCRPIKNTTKQEVYNAIYEIKEILREDK